MRRKAWKFVPFQPSENLTDTLKRITFSPTLELAGGLVPQVPHGTPLALSKFNTRYTYFPTDKNTQNLQVKSFIASLNQTKNGNPAI